MNGISKPGPAGECSNSRQSRAVVLLCLSSVLHLCRPGSAAVCLQGARRSVLVHRGGCMLLHCSYVLPGTLFSSVRWVWVTAEDIRLMALVGWQQNTKKDLPQWLCIRSLHGPEPPLSWLTSAVSVASSHLCKQPVCLHSCPGVQPLSGALRQRLFESMTA